VIIGFHFDIENIFNAFNGGIDFQYITIVFNLSVFAVFSKEFSNSIREFLWRSYEI